MKEITSQDNKIYKLCSKLQSRKYRDALSQYIIEGPNIIAEALREDIPVDFVLLREGTDAGGLLTGYTGEVFIMGNKLFDRLAQTENSQGIIAAAAKKNITEDAFFKSAGHSNILVLDRLQDPGNIGTMIRTADAAGFGGIMLLKGSGDVYSPKVVRAAAGSLFRVPLLFTDTPAKAAALLKAGGKKLISTCFDTDNYYYDIDISRDTALIIGNEGNGICEELIRLSDMKVKIPMRGHIDSLNAAVAAGILMYESMRK